MSRVSRNFWRSVMTSSFYRLATAAIRAFQPYGVLFKALVREDFSSTLTCWKHSSFSVVNWVRIRAEDHTARVALAQYIARAPLCLDKLCYPPPQGKVDYTSDFIPPQGVRRNRHFGVYPSRGRWRWSRWNHIPRHPPALYSSPLAVPPWRDSLRGSAKSTH